MFISACAQINVRENLFVCVSAFVMKMSYLLNNFIEHNFIENTCTFTEKSEYTLDTLASVSPHCLTLVITSSFSGTMYDFLLGILK